MLNIQYILHYIEKGPIYIKHNKNWGYFLYWKICVVHKGSSLIERFPEVSCWTWSVKIGSYSSLKKIRTINCSIPASLRTKKTSIKSKRQPLTSVDETWTKSSIELDERMKDHLIDHWAIQNPWTPELVHLLPSKTFLEFRLTHTNS